MRYTLVILLLLAGCGKPVPIEPPKWVLYRGEQVCAAHGGVDYGETWKGQTWRVWCLDGTYFILEPVRGY